MTVRGNTAGLGGGIAVEDEGTIGGTVTLNDSTVTGNTAFGLGGGIFIAGGSPPFPAPVVTLNDSTVTGNTAGALGGGILNDGTLIQNGTSSVTGNTPDDISS